jgi:exosortase/archaeosortase family protein
MPDDIKDSLTPLLKRMRGFYNSIRCRINPVILFLLIASVMLIFFYALVLPSNFIAEKFYPFYIKLNAKLASVILSLFYHDVSSDNSLIHIPGYSISLIKGCEALEPTCFFIIGILAFKASICRKLIGIVAGTFLLFILNLLRIVSLFYFGRSFQGIVHEIHIYIWPAVYIFLTILIWIIWLKWAISGKSVIGNAQL